MNRRKNLVDKAVDRSAPVVAVIVAAVVSVLAVGWVRAALYSHGVQLIPHWYDAPFRWVAKSFFS